ncbi:MAG: hypothetical protein WBJ82_03920, partial [Tepidanaerobacteraceae bacterium]
KNSNINNFKGYTTQRVCDIARCIKKMGIPLSLIILQQIDIIIFIPTLDLSFTIVYIFSSLTLTEDKKPETH